MRFEVAAISDLDLSRLGAGRFLAMEFSELPAFRYFHLSSSEGCDHDGVSISD